MNEGGFALVTASGDASLRLIAGKRVQPVNTDLIPSWKTVDERLQSSPWHTVDGVHYGVPYQWGANVLAYNTKVFPEAPKSWSVVFEEQNLPDGKSNKGRVQAFDGPIYIADAALYLMHKKPELGIKDPYELTEEQYKAALDLLRAISCNSESLDAYLQNIAPAAGCDEAFDAQLQDVLNALAQNPAGAPARARWLAEKMVLLLQTALLVQHAPAFVSEAFIATRLRQSEGTYGVVDLGAQDVGAILDRAAVGGH